MDTNPQPIPIKINGNYKMHSKKDTEWNIFCLNIYFDITQYNDIYVHFTCIITDGIILHKFAGTK